MNGTNSITSNVEAWADVTDYEGVYQVSTLGRVRSLPRTVRNNRGFAALSGKVLRTSLAAGYPSVSFWHLHVRRTFYVHILVLRTFVGDSPAGMQGCHWDGNPKNSRLDNLRWDTPAGNSADRLRHGTDWCGERCKTAVLTARDVAEIRKRYTLGGCRQLDLAAEFGVDQSNISLIVNGKSWAVETVTGVSL